MTVRAREPDPALRDARADRRLGAARTVIGVLALSVALFVVRFVLFADLAVVTPEECHTGGIARELIAHGVRFPFRAYSPELYENGIVLEGAMAVPFFLLFGARALSLKLLGHVVGTATAVVGLALLRRAADALEITARPARLAAAAAFVALLAFAPRLVTLHATSALGDHSEGTLLNLVLLLAWTRRREAPTAARFVVLWLCSGFFVFWEKGSLLAVAVAGAYEVVKAPHVAQARAGARVDPDAVSRWLRLPAALALALLAGAPAWLSATSTGFRDWGTVAEKFGRSGASAFGRFASSVWLFFDRNPIAIVVFALSVGWFGREALRRGGPLAGLAGYVALHLLVVVPAADGGPSSYLLYGYPVQALAVALAATSAAERVGAFRRADSAARRAATCAGAAAAAAVLLFPKFRVDPRHPVVLWEACDEAACAWRFGRAFLHEVGESNPERALDACRRLDADASLECVAGLARELRSPARWTLSGREHDAYAFGLGLGQGGQGGELCRALDDDGRKRTCEGGVRLECLAYADLLDRVVFADRLGAPRCDLREPPFSGYYAGLRAELLGRQPEPPPPWIASGMAGGCADVLRSCLAVDGPRSGSGAPVVDAH